MHAEYLQPQVFRVGRKKGSTGFVGQRQKKKHLIYYNHLNAKLADRFPRSLFSQSLRFYTVAAARFGCNHSCSTYHFPRKYDLCSLSRPFVPNGLVRVEGKKKTYLVHFYRSAPVQPFRALPHWYRNFAFNFLSSLSSLQPPPTSAVRKWMSGYENDARY